MTIAPLKAHRWILTVALAAGLALTGWLARSTLISFPLVTDPVPARILIGIGVSLVALLPLYASFPELEDTLVREPRLRILRVSTATLLATAAVTPAWTMIADPRWQGNATLFALNLAVGFLAVSIVGELAWAAPFSVGVLAVLLDNGPAERVTRVLDTIPAVATVLLLLLACATYVRLGPRFTGGGHHRWTS